MLRRLLFVALVLALSLPAAASIVITREFDSTALQRKWSYAVYLPDGYETSNLKYPVLYLLHGHGQDLYAWVNFGHIQPTTDELIAHGEIPPAIIVMPDAGTTWFVDRKEKMETAVIQDLIGDVQHTFRVIEARNGRVVAGLSMGGYGALRFVLKYPEMFAAAGLLSPAIYDPEVPQGSGARRAGVFGAAEFDPQVWKELNYPTLWEAFLAKKIAVPMYINSGDDDDFFIEAEATRLYSLLRKNGQPAELRIVDGAHKWPVWESTIGDAMRYVFRYAARPALVTDAKARKSR
ncbi:MAG TPA: alpha/beta hydrolase-fold protein [Steroidobacteraceae bacterium]|nr:alpha/beta hydrolase-fold protein [Steroidobacteraceae bacterium]